MAKRWFALSLVIWLGAVSGVVRAQSLPIPNPSRFLGDLQYNAFGKRFLTTDFTFNAFNCDPPYDQSLHGAIHAGLRDAAFMGPRMNIDFDYLLLFIQAPTVPPLLTTSTEATGGAIGAAGTSILYSGTVDYDPLSGGRLRAIWSIVDQFEVLGAFYLSEQRSNIFDVNSDAAGSPTLARPFFNRGTGLQDRALRASTTGPVQGFTHSSLSSQIMGADALVRWSEPQRIDSPAWSIFGGFAFLSLEEQLFVADVSGGTLFVDDFSTANQLYGGQIGAQMDWCFPDGLCTLFAKVAIGGVQQQLDITGTGTGVYAQATNIGSYEQWKVGVVPEFGLNVNYCIHERIRLSAGYTFMYFVNVIRPADQIDSVDGVPASSPTFSAFDNTNVWIQSLNFGLRFVF